MRLIRNPGRPAQPRALNERQAQRSPQMKFASVVLSLFLLCSFALASEIPVNHAKASSDELLLPANYRSWVKLSSSTPGLPGHRHKHVASKVFVEPAAFDHFTKTGEWPNHTVIVLEISSGPASTNAKSDVKGLEAAVKNDARFPDPWSYYGIVYERPQQPSGTMKVETPCDCDQSLDSMLALAFPTLRAVINAKPSSMSQNLF